MKRDYRWTYTLLGTGGFLVVLFLVYLSVAARFNLPLVSLLPSSPLRNSTISPSSTPGVKPTSIQRFTSTRGMVWYDVVGKFVTTPTYDAAGVLQSDFVINQDPSEDRIPVIMTIKNGKITVGRSQGASVSGTIVWKLEDTENLRQSIKVNEPVQLRLQPLTPNLTAYDLSVQKTMDSILAGYWSIPADFVLHPYMVGLGSPIFTSH